MIGVRDVAGNMIGELICESGDELIGELGELGVGLLG
jgi:hypothetical protein